MFKRSPIKGQNISNVSVVSQAFLLPRTQAGLNTPARRAKPLKELLLVPNMHCAVCVTESKSGCTLVEFACLDFSLFRPSFSG